MILRNTIIVVAIAGASLAGHTATPAPAPQAQPVITYKWGQAKAPAKLQEDDPGWNCATMGNHVCGPGNTEHLPAGCYDDAMLVLPWAQLMQTPWKWATPEERATASSPCAGMAPTQEQQSDAAYVAAAQCATDAQCAEYDRAHGQTPDGYGTTDK